MENKEIQVHSDHEFIENLEAQMEQAYSKFIFINEEFDRCEPDSQTSRASRIVTLELIASIKNILDQITFEVWSSIFGEDGNEKVAKDVYYPYAADEQMFRSALGKITKNLAVSNSSENVEKFTDCLRSTQPFGGIDWSLVTVGKLSRLHHRKLIDQKKTRCYTVEAYSPGGGGASMTFHSKPGPFTIWTYTGRAGVSTGMGKYPIVNKEEDPDGKVVVHRFNPETMDFAHVEGARTSVSEFMECNVEDMHFDALDLFQRSLAAVGEIVEISRDGGYLGTASSDA
ncbi:hypothetical protein [Pseudomonas luteola]|uniref:hypothetical protein n=1 Tax=Pseudomonas luteola TaxID=47886 RepID=UPI00091E3F76|nr:hypothetical protein [Pseudomonas zeshuii]SHI32672.1 hypothetical protein SAMN05216295_101219 [Pseudomonas zeshuii]